MIAGEGAPIPLSAGCGLLADLVVCGALLGGLLLGLVENYASGLFGGEWMHLAAFVVLIVLLMFRPTGLLGESLGRARA